MKVKANSFQQQFIRIYYICESKCVLKKLSQLRVVHTIFIWLIETFYVSYFSDRKIADHVVKVHQYRDPREADGDVTVISAGASELATHSKAQQVTNIIQKKR